jgi:hypothetical protein
MASLFAKLIAEIFRDYATDGVPASGAHKPVKSDIRAWGLTVEKAVPHLSILDADRTGSDVNTAQAVLGTTQDALTVEASTTYEIEAVIIITRAAGTTSHTTGFLLGGTATFTAIDALAKCSNPTGNVLGAVSEIQVTAATETVLTAANTSATENVRITLKGHMRINGAGTVIPQFKYSAAPGGAPTIKRGSYFKATKVGAGDVTFIGNWG